MKRFIISRLLQLIPILFGITFLTFSMMQFSMTDAVDMMYEQSGGAVEEVKTAKRAELGLDKPFMEQYVNWLGGVVTGDMGKSYISGKLVFETFEEKVPATFLLMVVSLVFTVLVATPLGILAAVKQNSKIDYFIRCFTFVGNSMPNFFVALILIYFCVLKLNLFPLIGKPSGAGVVLPALTLAIAMGSKYTRQIRALTLEELGKNYIVGARSRGVSEFNILTKSVLKSISLMIITLIALSMGSLFGGAAIVETIFMWDGVGKMAVDAVLMRDYPLIQAYALWMSVIYAVINLLTDILYHSLDPRVKLWRKGNE